MDYTTLGLGLLNYLGRFGSLWLSRGSIPMLCGGYMWYNQLCSAAWRVWCQVVFLMFAGAISILVMWVESATLWVWSLVRVLWMLKLAGSFVEGFLGMNYG